MDKAIAEWNGRIFYYLIFAALALLVGYLWWRYLRQRQRETCDYCGRNLSGRSKYRDAVQGMPRKFCNRKCADNYREKGPMPGDQRQILRAEETIMEEVNPGERNS